MGYTIRPHKKRGKVDGLEVDFIIRMPDGVVVRERRKSPATSKSGTERWAQQREREILTKGLAPKVVKKVEVPTLSAFWPRFLRDHVKANAHKPAGEESKEFGYRAYLQPRLGHMGLEEISTEEVQKLKAWMLGERKLEKGTVNNTLALLSIVLKTAIEWHVLDKMPCRITRLKVSNTVPDFYDFDVFEVMVDAARELGAAHYLVMLLGGDAGLRRGEIMALDQARCDTRNKKLEVSQSEWRGHVSETKGMAARIIPMTDRLAAAIAAHRHLKSPRLLVPTYKRMPKREGPLRAGARTIRTWMTEIQTAAELPKESCTGEVHILRHSFCSHLAMRGAPAPVIQKLAGHKSLTTTLRYMHLAPGETDRAIELLQRGQPVKPSKRKAET
ncbi:MAG TPA: site-specific integrase [Polyangiales bacterium]|nr:site-specific integrase [Polyangiales bacterium]